MDIYILRHAIAEDVSRTGKDRDRVLTDEGIRKTHEAGKALKKLEITFDLVLSSPFARAWQTAEIVVRELDCKKLLESCEPLGSGGPSSDLLAELKTASERASSLLVVGHEPDLSGLISILLSGSEEIAITMKKGGLCKLVCASPEAGAARLEWLLTPKQLCRIA